MINYTERKAFESAVTANFEKPTDLTRDGDGYSDGYVDNAWWGWQAALSTKAQPEVTGAVYVLKDKLRVLQHSIDLHVCLHKSPNHNLRPASDFTPLYPPSAIEATVREKLEEVVNMIEHTPSLKDPDDTARLIQNKVRALMESPQPSVEEPAN